MCSCVTVEAGKPIGLMNSFIGNCQHQNAAGDSFVRLTEIALEQYSMMFHSVFGTHINNSLLQHWRNYVTVAGVNWWLMQLMYKRQKKRVCVYIWNLTIGLLLARSLLQACDSLRS